MKIIEKLVLDMTGPELRQCRSLSLRADGLMCETLTEIRNTEPDRIRKHRLKRRSRAWMIRDDSDKLLAWALITPLQERRGYEAQFYTRKSERGKGYGTMLMNEVLKYDRKPFVFPHDRKSGDFFKKHRRSIRFEKYDEMWLK